MTNIIDFPQQGKIEEEASLWIVRFDGLDNPSSQQIAEFKQWMATSPAHREAIIRLATLWEEMAVLSLLQIPDVQVSRNQSGRLSRWVSSWRNRFPMPLRVAISGTAALVLTAVLALSLDLLPAGSSSSTYTTRIGESLSATLQDGSQVWLNTASQVTVEYSASTRRLNLVKGEAHFEVVPDSARAFEVYAGSKLIRAVGTAFSVLRESDDVRVMVTEGTVELAALPLLEAPGRGTGRNQPAATEDPGSRAEQRIGYLEAGQSIVLEPVETEQAMAAVESLAQQDADRRLAWREGRLIFTGEPLHEVVREVSRYTPLQIQIMDAGIRQMRIGGQFKVGEMAALFDVLENGFGLRIAHIDTDRVEIYRAP